MNLFIDNREQKPLKFKGLNNVDSLTQATLPFGDYACKHNDIRIPVVFERKSLGDLMGTLTRDIERFKREVNRVTEEGCRLVIIIECSLLEIRKGYKYSKGTKGISIIRTLFTLLTKYKIPFVTCSSRKEMELYIVEFYSSYIKNILK